MDRNQKQIVEFFKACGCPVLSLSRLGDGCPDLLVYIPKAHRFCLVEVKTKHGQLTEKQKAFMQNWPVAVVRDLADAQDLLNRF